MCGISGWITLDANAAAPTREALQAMVLALRHRGPDELGLYRDAIVGLGHARLSIIDVGTGQQPMSNGRGTSWIVYNGEVFNYVELRAELLGRGRRFRTQSDTEVILEAYDEWGADCFERFNGQFALAIWDSERMTLVLARDRLGVRPLYLAEAQGRLLFASEVRALFAGDPGLPRELDPVGIAETFTFWSPVAPQTVFRGIRELEPGHVRLVSPRRTIDRAYWTPSFPVVDGAGHATDDLSIEEAADRLGDALEEAVRLRMLRADVPVGSYLSGGLDSSLIAALGKRAKGDGFATFSIRFDDPEYDETVFQRQMAARVGGQHHEVVVASREIAAVFPDVVAHAERPILRTAPAPLFLLARLVREMGIKVVLTGEGADEMLAGYDIFSEARVRRFWARRPDSRLRPLLLQRLYPYLARSPASRRSLARAFFGQGLESFAEPGFGHQPRWRSTAALQQLFSPAFRAEAASIDVVGRLLDSLPADLGSWSTLAQDQYLEARTLLPGYILSSQGDRMLMANSVEGRFPFLDANVVDIANGLPASAKLLGLDAKHVLKRVARGLVPQEIIDRPKQPYRAPGALAFLGSDRPDWVDELLSERAVRDAGVFDERAVDRMWRKVRDAPDDTRFSNTDDMAMVGVLSTGLVHERLIVHNGRPQGSAFFTTFVDLVASPAGTSSTPDLEPVPHV